MNSENWDGMKMQSVYTIVFLLPLINKRRLGIMPVKVWNQKVDNCITTEKWAIYLALHIDNR